MSNNHSYRKLVDALIVTDVEGLAEALFAAENRDVRWEEVGEVAREMCRIRARAIAAALKEQRSE